MPQIGYVQTLRLGSAASGHSSCARDALHSQKLIAQKRTTGNRETVRFYSKLLI
jgi:hypothetical protein